MTAGVAGQAGSLADERGLPALPVRTVDPVAGALGVASLGLAAALLAAPGPVLRRAGLRDSPGARLAARAVGIRELAVGVGIVASRRPVGWLWARVAGDVVDVAALGLGAVVQGGGGHRRGGLGRPRRSSRAPRSTALALGGLAGVGFIDVVAAIRLTRRRGPHRTATVAVTVDRPRDEVYRRWRELQDFPRFLSHLDLRPAGARTGPSPLGPSPGTGGRVAWEADVVNDVPGELIEWRSGIASDVDHAGTARFDPDPSGAGTLVTVRVDYRPPGGLLGSLVAGLFGEHPRQQIGDDLVRFKHLVEADDS